MQFIVTCVLLSFFFSKIKGGSVVATIFPNCPDIDNINLFLSVRTSKTIMILVITFLGCTVCRISGNVANL